MAKEVAVRDARRYFVGITCAQGSFLFRSVRRAVEFASCQNIIADVVIGDREKDDHEWQQAESEAIYFIKELSAEGGLVVDLFSEIA